MIFYNNVQVDSGSDTYDKGRFPKLKAYVGPVIGTYGEDAIDGYFVLNNYDNTQIKLCGGYGFKPGYCVAIGGLSIETINTSSGWIYSQTVASGGISIYSTINYVNGNFNDEIITSGGLYNYSTVNLDTLVTIEYISSASM